MATELTNPPSGTLFVVSTPIGNMGDFSFRAVEVLRSVDAILAEDTRHSRHLLDRYEIKSPLVSYHEHNEAKRTSGLIARLQSGENLALISDAGTPLLSDPGARLVQAAVEAGCVVSPIPGASALLAALVGSGLLSERFTYFGFLPRKGAERVQTLEEVTALEHTAVIYEAANRVSATLTELAACGAADRATVVGRELTKQFEEFRRGTVGALAAYYTETPPRGEIVIVVEGRVAPPPASDDELRILAQELRAKGQSSKDISQALMRQLGASRNVAYRIAHE